MALELIQLIGIIIAIIAGTIAIIQFIPKAIKWINSKFGSTPDESQYETGPNIKINLENCYYTVNDQPISTIHAEFLVHNRGDRNTTIYEVEMTDIVLDLMNYVLDPYFRVQVPVGPDETIRMNARYSFPGIEIEGDIDLTLMIRYTHGQYSIACTAFVV